jgi:hypothetical protein
MFLGNITKMFAQVNPTVLPDEKFLPIPVAESLINRYRATAS